MNLTRIVSYYLALVLVLLPFVLACGEDPVTSGGCRCTSSKNINGETVQYVGCDNHIGDSCFCYVKNPNNCNDGDLGPNTTIHTDPIYNGQIKWRDCGESIVVKIQNNRNSCIGSVFIFLTRSIRL